MKKAILSVFIIFSCFVAEAQKRDTTIYIGCLLANDTTLSTDNPTILDSCPQFQNGFDDLYKYISTHFHYPSRKNKTDIRVIISMIIEKDGSVSNAKVERGVANDIDRKALGVINSLPKWKPGTLQGQPVRVKYFVIVSSKRPEKKSYLKPNI